MFELLRNLLDGLAVSFDLPILDWIAANLWCPIGDTVMPIITMFPVSEVAKTSPRFM